MNIKPLLPSINPRTFLADYLKANGIADVEQYLHPPDSVFQNPWDYPNMDRAVELATHHFNQNSSIGIVKDSDQDGDCATSVVYLLCKMLGIIPIVFAHSQKQHGLDDLVDDIIDSGVNLLIVPDAGTNCIKECRQLKEANIDIIILDHHEIEQPNPYAIVVNNHSSPNINQDLSGCGVAYKFVQAYCDKHDIDCPNYNDIVAVSIVADMCLLNNLENRAFVDRGLTNPTNTFLKLLFEKKCKRRGVTPDGISWDVSPLANALARMDDKETKLLFFDSMVGNIPSDQALTDIMRVKRKQDEGVKVAMEELEPNLDTSNKFIVDFTDAKNKGFIGLIANKITGKHGKPSIILRELNSTTWSGSLRSPVPLANIINESKLAKCQGHLEACGCVVKKSNLNKLKKFLETLDLSADPDIEVACEIEPIDVTLKMAQDIIDNNILWGRGLSKPTFHITLINPNVQVFVKKSTTIKLTANNLEFILFFASDKDVEALLKPNISVEMIVELSINEWNGVKSPQCIIKKYEVHEAKPVEEDWETLF